MTDERYTFTQARTRLEDIVVQVRKKDCSLEQSLELLEEGVRLANVCTELSDHTEWASAEVTTEAPVAERSEELSSGSEDEPVALAETVEVTQPDDETVDEGVSVAGEDGTDSEAADDPVDAEAWDEEA